MNLGLKCCLICWGVWIFLGMEATGKMGVGLYKECTLAYRILLIQFLYLTFNKPSTGSFVFMQRVMIKE